MYRVNYGLSMSGGKEMDIEVGAEVFDKKGANLGKVDYVIRDTWLVLNSTLPRVFPRPVQS